MAIKKEGHGRGSSVRKAGKANSTRGKAGPKARAKPSPKPFSQQDNNIAKPEAKATDKGADAEPRKKPEAATSASPANVLGEYHTILDDIYDLIQQEGSVELTKLSARINVPADRLEAWAKIFDRDGLMELDYPMMGDIRINRKGYGDKAKAAPQPKTAAAQASTTVASQPGAAVKYAAPAGAAKKDAPLAAANDATASAAVKASAAKTAPASAQENEGKDEPDTDDKQDKKPNIMIIAIVLVIIALVGALVFFLMKGGYIQFV